MLGFRAISSADLSDSKWTGSSDDSDAKLCVNDIKSECSASGTLPFAAAMSSSRCSSAHSLAFLKTLAPCWKVSDASVIAKDLS